MGSQPTHVRPPPRDATSPAQDSMKPPPNSERYSVPCYDQPRRRNETPESSLIMSRVAGDGGRHAKSLLGRVRDAGSGAKSRDHGARARVLIDAVLRPKGGLALTIALLSFRKAPVQSVRGSLICSPWRRSKTGKPLPDNRCTEPSRRPELSNLAPVRF